MTELKVTSVKQSYFKRRPPRIIEDFSSDKGSGNEQVPQPLRKTRRPAKRVGEIPVAPPAKGRELPVAPLVQEGETLAAPSAKSSAGTTICSPPLVPGNWTEEFVTRIMRLLRGGMMSARFKVIKSRL